MEKVSIIVPIYNVAKFLNKCISSLVSQTYQNIQIILVNDGSTDSSLQIALKWQNIDDRVEVLQEKNSGAGPARNLGIQAATGDRIVFIDGDDFLKPQHIEHLMQRMKQTQADIVCSSFYILDMNGHITHKIVDPNNLSQIRAAKTTFDPTEWVKLERTEPMLHNFLAPWGKLYYYKLFEKIEYPHHSYCDDAMTTWKLYLSAHKIAYTNVDDYCYRIRSSSITGNTNINMTERHNDVTSIEERIAFYNQLNISNDFIKSRYLDSLHRLHTGAAIKGSKSDFINSKYRLKLINKYN